MEKIIAFLTQDSVLAWLLIGAGVLGVMAFALSFVNEDEAEGAKTRTLVLVLMGFVCAAMFALFVLN